MTAKVLYVFCAQVLLVQVDRRHMPGREEFLKACSARQVIVAIFDGGFATISGYCTNGAWPTAIGAGEGFGWPAPGYGYEAPLMAASPCAGPAPFLGAYDLAAIPSSYGGGFSVTSMSPVPPHGLSVMSDNAIEGVLVVGGELPFLSTVGLEGALPTAGVGSISYGCGNGNVGMVSEDILPMAAGLGWPATGMNYGPVMGNGLGYGAPWTASIMDYGLGCGAVY